MQSISGLILAVPAAVEPGGVTEHLVVKVWITQAEAVAAAVQAIEIAPLAAPELFLYD